MNEKSLRGLPDDVKEVVRAARAWAQAKKSLDGKKKKKAHPLGHAIYNMQTTKLLESVEWLEKHLKGAKKTKMRLTSCREKK